MFYRPIQASFLISLIAKNYCSTFNMDTKEDPYFILELMNLVFQATGKPLPVNLQHKFDAFSKREENYVTLNIRKAVMIFISECVVSDETHIDVASEIYEAKKKELGKKYTHCDFLNFLSYFIYASLLEYVNNKQDSPEMLLSSIQRFMFRMRKKGRFEEDFWRNLDEAAAKIVDHDRKGYKVLPLRKTNLNLDMTVEKSFVLKMMTYVFDLQFRNLPIYLLQEIKGNTIETENEPSIKNAVFILLSELGKKIQVVGSIELVFRYYFNLAMKHFSEKNFLEFCVYGTQKALIEYSNESREESPKRAYELLVHILQLAKEDGKLSSLEEMIEAAKKLLEEDRDRIEHERARRDFSIEDSGNAQLTSDSDNLISPNQNSATIGCKCCTVT